MNFFNFFGANPKSIDLPGGDIRMIGARDVGKTSYLAALAICWQAESYVEGRIKSVGAYGDAARKILDNAENFLKDGEPMPSSNKDEKSQFLIKLKPRFLMNPVAAILRKTLRLEIMITAHTGELIEDLIDGDFRDEPIKNLSSVVHLMIILDSKACDRDKDYAKGIASLQTELEKIPGNSRRSRQYRIAIVFTKGEANPVYRYNKKQSQLFTELKFPETNITLKNWQQNWGCSMNFFICSAFGFIGDTLEPNCKEVKSYQYTLRDPDTRAWQPFGLVAPIYWLQTGKDDYQLRK